MKEIFEDEFVTWRHNTPIGVKVDEVFGMESKSGKVWEALARQIYCEQGESFYREILYFPNGAPYINNLPARISITHTDHFFAGAVLPKTPDIDLAVFNPRTAMGIDAESLEREKVLKLRERYLTQQELEFIKEDDLEANIMAWTSKEALYKAAMTPGLDFRKDINIIELPDMDRNPDDRNFKYKLGKAKIKITDEICSSDYEMILYSYESYGCCVTIALSPKCPVFQKGGSAKI